LTKTDIFQQVSVTFSNIRIHLNSLSGSGINKETDTVKPTGEYLKFSVANAPKKLLVKHHAMKTNGGVKV
jgi:hypothetical protein